MSAFWEEQKAIFWKQTMDLAIRQGEGAFVVSNLSVQGLAVFTWMAYWKKKQKPTISAPIVLPLLGLPTRLRIANNLAVCSVLRGYSCFMQRA